MPILILNILTDPANGGVLTIYAKKAILQARILKKGMSMTRARWMLVQGAFASVVVGAFVGLLIYAVVRTFAPNIAPQSGWIAAAFALVCGIASTYRVAERYRFDGAREGGEEDIATIAQRKRWSDDAKKEQGDEEKKRKAGKKKETVIRCEGGGYMDDEGFHPDAPDDDDEEED